MGLFMLHSVPDKPWRQFTPVTPGSALVTVLLAVVVVSALYFGREVLVPIALAILLSFVLAPLCAYYKPATSPVSWRLCLR